MLVVEPVYEVKMMVEKPTDPGLSARLTERGCAGGSQPAHGLRALSA